MSTRLNFVSGDRFWGFLVIEDQENEIRSLAIQEDDITVIAAFAILLGLPKESTVLWPSRGYLKNAYHYIQVQAVPWHAPHLNSHKIIFASESVVAYQPISLFSHRSFRLEPNTLVDHVMDALPPYFAIRELN
jgi:hypothetical protein